MKMEIMNQVITDEISPIAIKLSNLSKSFGNFRALKNLNIEIKKGEIFGLIGPNGAGKTTAISLILGLLKKETNSEIKILNKDIPSQLEKVNDKIGFMPQEVTLYEDLSIKQNLEYFGALYGMRKKEIISRMEEVLTLVNLSQFKDRLIKNCSGGMKRRSSLATALLHDPELLILDEPTVGIDPELRITFWDYFKILAKQGKTILITTHYLTESIKCDRIGFLNQEIITIGEPVKLQNLVKKEKKLDNIPDMEEVFLFFVSKTKEDIKNIQGGSNIE